MKNKIILIPIVLLLIGISLWKTGVFNKGENTPPTVIHKVEQKDTHVGHGHTPSGEAIKPKGARILVEGGFTQPLYCNNGISLLFTDAKGNNLYYQKNEQSTPIILLNQLSVGNNIGWSKDCETVFYKEKTADYKIIIKSINVNTKEIKNYPNYPPQIELRSLSISDTVYYLDSKTLAIKAIYGSNEWNISTEKGNYYKLLISPNNKYIVAHDGAKIKLFSTSGSFIRDLGRGIATDWSPDSRKLIGFLDESEDGHEVSGSELYFFYLSGEAPEQITFTANAFEMWPVFKSQNQIVYTDEVNKGLFIKDI